MTVIVYPDAVALARTTGVRLLVEIGDAVAARGVAHIILTGGRGGGSVLAAIAEAPSRDDVDWMSVHVWWSDERFVPVGDPERNEGQAQSILLGHLLLPEENIHRIASPETAATASDAAEAYARELALYGDPCPRFDVALLGLGDDGHVASLFPGRAELAEAVASVVAVEGAPKPPPSRVTLTLPTLCAAAQVWIVAAGAGKARAVAACLAPDSAAPGARVSGRERTLWLIDALASIEA